MIWYRDVIVFSFNDASIGIIIGIIIIGIIIIGIIPKHRNNEWSCYCILFINVYNSALNLAQPSTIFHYITSFKSQHNCSCDLMTLL